MSHVIFILILAFVAWQWLRKSRRRARDARSDVGRPASPLSESTYDAGVDEVAADVAAVVSSFLGQKGEERIGQAVSRAILDSKVGIAAGRKPAKAMEPVKQASRSTKAASQAPARQRARYLLDGDSGYRQRTDRTARLQQSFRGKGLCSPR